MTAHILPCHLEAEALMLAAYFVTHGRVLLAMLWSGR